MNNPSNPSNPSNGPNQSNVPGTPYPTTTQPNPTNPTDQAAYAGSYPTNPTNGATTTPHVAGISKIRATAAFTRTNGATVAKDSVIDVPDAEAAALIAQGKAVQAVTSNPQPTQIPNRVQKDAGNKGIIPVRDAKTGVARTFKPKK